jgi:hypothetical protein
MKPQQAKKARGRPRKPPPGARRLSHRLTEFGAHIGKSRMTLWRWLHAGKLRYVQPVPGGPIEVPITEYLRLGYVESLDELDRLLGEDRCCGGSASTRQSASPRTAAPVDDLAKLGLFLTDLAKLKKSGVGRAIG